MDYDFQSAARVSNRGSSAVIELDLAFGKRASGFQRMSMNEGPANRHSTRQSRQSGNEIGALSETLEQITSELGKAWMVAPEDECPERPLDIEIYNDHFLTEMCRTNRESLYPRAYRYVTLSFRIMRRNAAMYVGYMLSQKGVRRSDLYKVQYLPIWTHCLRVKMRVNVKVGVIFHGLKSRLGLTSVRGLHFCIDGFLGVEAYGDAFGNVGTGVCPWMELSGNGSPKSLRLSDGDNIYLSVATESMRQLVQQRKLQAAGRVQPMANAMKYEAGMEDSSRHSGSISALKRERTSLGDFMKQDSGQASPTPVTKSLEQ